MAQSRFTFIDLFAGIGGFRIAFEELNGVCVMASECDKFAQRTYREFFGHTPDFSEILTVNPPGDITQLPPEAVPNHDILTGGFPCQPFSLAGVSKKNSLGMPHGFDDPAQGTLFYNIQEIIRAKRPKAFLLENVKNLRSHDKGNTYRVIRESLDNLGYNVFDRTIDAAGWVPQHRERIFLAGFRRPENGQTWSITEFPEFFAIHPPFRRLYELDDVLENDAPEKYIIGPGTWATLERHKANHEKKGNGFGYSIIRPPFKNKITRTLSARYHKDGAEILIDIGADRPRRLTPLECCRLMGFPEQYQRYFARDPEYPQPISDTQAYRQFGNSVVVPVASVISEAIVSKLEEQNALSHPAWR
jgi:DNA (cytosine-5)-methyltransferase 1